MNKFKSGDTVWWMFDEGVSHIGVVVKYMEDEFDIILVESVAGLKYCVVESELTKIKFI